LPVPTLHSLLQRLTDCGLGNRTNVDIVYRVATYPFRSWDGCRRSCRVSFPSTSFAISVRSQKCRRTYDVLHQALGSAALCSLRTDRLQRVCSRDSRSNLDGFRHRKVGHRCAYLLRADKTYGRDDGHRNHGWNLGRLVRCISWRVIGQEFRGHNPHQSGVQIHTDVIQLGYTLRTELAGPCPQE
jgi:hypothetical protein